MAMPISSPVGENGSLNQPLSRLINKSPWGIVHYKPDRYALLTLVVCPLSKGVIKAKPNLIFQGEKPKNGITITQRQYTVRNCREKQQILAKLRQKRYFKKELKHLKRFGHVTDDVMSLFWSRKNYQVEHYFPAN